VSSKSTLELRVTNTPVNDVYLYRRFEYFTSCRKPRASGQHCWFVFRISRIHIWVWR